MRHVGRMLASQKDYKAVGKSENPGEGGCNVLGIFSPPPVEIELTDLSGEGWGG